MSYNNKNQKSSNSMNEEFGYETDVNEVKQLNQKAEAKKQQASGSFAKNSNSQMQNQMNVEFGYETDVNEVKKLNQKAEAKKQQASGSFANNSNQNNKQY